MRSSWNYRRGQSVEVRVREDWEVRCHPASAEAFRAHAEDDELQQELEGFLRFVTPDMVLMDIGSHYGVFTLAAIHYGGPGVSVVAVDPSRDVNPIFEANVKLARAADRVQLFEVAVGSSDGRLHMLSTNAAGDQMFVASPPRSDARQVEMLSVPSVVEKARRTPTHIKIDVEGFEDEVIGGAESFLAKYKPVIFLELHVQMLRFAGKSPEQILKTLASLRYKFGTRGTDIGVNQICEMSLCRLVATPV